MITRDMAEREILTGLSAVCAWCKHWHNTDGKGSVRVCNVYGCGGPSIGKGFPKYDGPMRGNIHRMCFICGGDADSMVDIGGSFIGVCNKIHKKNRPITCLGALMKILQRQNVVVNEKVLVKNDKI